MSNGFLPESIEVLERTPAVLDALLRGLPRVWIRATEGPGTWSPYDVLGHLIHGERADWIPRLAIILEQGTSRPFDPFDREAQFRESGDRPLEELLDEFARLRRENVEHLRRRELSDEQLGREGMHPALGRVTARQLLATWTAHDLGHVVQISRTMARRYRPDVGPWAEYMGVMKAE